MLFFVGFSFLEARAAFGHDKVRAGRGGTNKRVAGGIAPVMNARYLATDAFIDVINTRSRLEGDE